jgi:oligopeptidase A
MSPEGEALPAANPLLQFDAPFAFDRITPECVTPAVELLLSQCRTAVERVTDPATPAAWGSVVEPLEQKTQMLSRAWAAVSHLNAVADSPSLRAQYNANLPKLTQFWTELSQNLLLYDKYRTMAGRPQFPHWGPARRRTVENELRDFRLGGAELPPPKRERLRALRERESQIATRFAENVLDSTGAFALFVEDPAQLAGIPEDALEQYREAAQSDGRTGYKVTLHAPSYLPALQYAHDRGLRERLYRAYTTRASEFGPSGWDNTPLILELLKVRHEHAQLLGYRNFAELSLVPKMARSVDEVSQFLRDLAGRARPHAQREITELGRFANLELGLGELKPWDISFVAERLRQARYDYSEQDLKRYFPLSRVLPGLFELIERLFSVRIRPDQAPVWHPDVRFYRIDNDAGELVAQFYLDLYARDHKQGGAWQDDARSRWLRDSKLQTPISFLTCNFSRPAEGRPALLTHDEMLTLLHEFGHGLHHMLTRVDEPPVAGIHGVEWDAVELPSQFLENFGWQWQALQMLTEHVERNEKLPAPLFDRLIAARNFQSGMHLVRQLEFGLFDLRLHSEFDPERGDAAALQSLANEVRSEVAVVFPPPDHRGANSFTHIFSGGYAAGYYSYLWAEVLSSDCFAAFEELGDVVDPDQGKRFLDTILAVGGSRPAMESFVAFRGREPSIEPLLRHNGIASADAK